MVIFVLILSFSYTFAVVEAHFLRTTTHTDAHTQYTHFSQDQNSSATLVSVL